MLGLVRHARPIAPCRTILVYRLVHTSTKPSAETTSNTQPPPPSPVKKPKPALSPAPSKPKVTAGKSPVPNLASPPNATAASTPPLSQSEKVVAETADKGPIEAIKADFANATEHGVLAPAPPGASWLGTKFHQVKELFKFYKNGLVLIVKNARQASAIRQRLKQGGPPLTRWETRFLRLSDRDLKKLVPFALILIILEEALPFFVLYAPFMLPSTCLLVSQRLRIEKKRSEKQKALVSVSQDILQSLASGGDASGDLRILCGTLSLSSYGPSILRHRRLTNHLELVEKDDELLLAEANGVVSRIPSNLSKQELNEVLSERGFVVDETTDATKQLEWYFVQIASRDESLSSRFALVAKAALHNPA